LSEGWLPPEQPAAEKAMAAASIRAGIRFFIISVTSLSVVLGDVCQRGTFPLWRSGDRDAYHLISWVAFDQFLDYAHQVREAHSCSSTWRRARALPPIRWP